MMAKTNSTKISVYTIVLKTVYPEKKVLCTISGRKVSTVGILSTAFHYSSLFGYLLRTFFTKTSLAIRKLLVLWPIALQRLCLIAFKIPSTES